LDRLASAHKFWGVLHNNETPHPTFSKWLLRRFKNAKRDFADAKNGLGKPGSKGNDFLAMVGRPNFATWKFSGGTMPILSEDEPNQPFPLEEETKSRWQIPFETAIRTLSRFDLVIPMELLKQHPQPLNDLLGWEHDAQAQHIVNAGNVLNSNARTVLPDDTEYNALWDANRLDMILYHWTKAVYLTRIHCSSQPFLK
jgi:nucleoid-associated protein YgaU